MVRVGSNEQRYETATLTLALTADTQVDAVFSIDTSTEERDAPFATALAQNFPNPFNPSTVIGFQLSVAGKARLSVYDLLGREVAVLVNEDMPAGEHSATFDASNLASGVYIYRLQVGSEVLTRRMTLVK
jgi:glucuronoarabinoxylan endo-1,4-beta-xylanase